jgi:hypothetical protein
VRGAAGWEQGNVEAGQRLQENPMRGTAAFLLLLVAAFCVNGFFAAGEPGPNHIYFRVGYPVVGIASLAAAVALLMRKK